MVSFKSRSLITKFNLKYFSQSRMPFSASGSNSFEAHICTSTQQYGGGEEVMYHLSQGSWFTVDWRQSPFNICSTASYSSFNKFWAITFKTDTLATISRTLLYSLPKAAIQMVTDWVAQNRNLWPCCLWVFLALCQHLFLIFTWFSPLFLLFCLCLYFS